MKTELFRIGQVKDSAFVGTAGPLNPLMIVINQIPAGCQIQFNRIEFADGKSSTVYSCGAPVIHDATIVGIQRYKVCSCEPFMDADNTTLIIDQIGAYEAVLVGPCTTTGTVSAFVQSVPEYAGHITDGMRGCCAAQSNQTTDPCEIGQAVVAQGINWNQLISRDGSGCLQYGVPTNGEVGNTLTGVPFITFTPTGIDFLPVPFCESVNNCVTFPSPPNACSIGAGVSAGTIVALVGVDSEGCLVKQAVELVEFRDCENELLFNAYKIV